MILDYLRQFMLMLLLAGALAAAWWGMGWAIKTFY